jgi:hypothetical protein
MSTNAPNDARTSETSRIDLLLKLLQTTNALTPVAAQAVAGLIAIIKGGRSTGKTDEEIKAEAADSDATALRTQGKALLQMGSQG